MSANDSRHEKPPETADQYFLETYPVSPMVAIFISLPTLPTNKAVEKRTFQDVNIDKNLLIDGATQGKSVVLGVPHAMEGRRVLLYFFHRAYLDNAFVYDASKSHRDIAADFGYDNAKSRHPKEVVFHLIKLVYAKISFLYHEDNELYGLFNYSDTHNLMFDSTVKNDYITELRLNPNFMFNCAFPVDFKHVIGTRKKCFFWNIYLLLVDVLPRTKWRQKKPISWEFLHRLFNSTYTIENFKYAFKNTVKEVLEIYPQAKGKVDTSSDKKHLILSYAPPPIPRPVDDKPPPPRNPSPAAPAMPLTKNNVA